MTLTNYWWLLIWLAVAGGKLTLAVPQMPMNVLGKKEYRQKMISAIILIIPFILWAGFRSVNTKGFDTSMYYAAFLEAPSRLIELPTYLELVTKRI